MAKYVCDTDAVIKTSTDLDTAANTLLTEIEKISGQFNDAFSSWEGTAKVEAEAAIMASLADAKIKANEVLVFAEYLKQIAGGIDELEDSTKDTKL